MKKTLPILMIFAMVFPTFIKVGILIDFKINQDFIANVLCINKEELKPNCNGQCYLTKQLKKAEEQEEKQAPNNKNERPEVVYFHAKSWFGFLTDHALIPVKVNAAYENRFHHIAFTATIFRPPKLDLI